MSVPLATAHEQKPWTVKFLDNQLDPGSNGKNCIPCFTDYNVVPIWKPHDKNNSATHPSCSQSFQWTSVSSKTLLRNATQGNESSSFLRNEELRNLELWLKWWTTARCSKNKTFLITHCPHQGPRNTVGVRYGQLTGGPEPQLQQQ